MGATTLLKDPYASVNLEFVAASATNVNHFTGIFNPITQMVVKNAPVIQLVHLVVWPYATLMMVNVCANLALQKIAVHHAKMEPSI